MKPEKQRIAIAETCGWKGISHEYLTGYAPWRPTPYIERVMGDLDNIPIDPLPNYLNDLNAMHEAEKVLDEDQQYSYGEELRTITGNVGPRGGHFIPNGWGVFSLATVTAAQRAEAFLRTFNLWQAD